MPEWYFLGVFKLMHMVPPLVGFGIMGVAVGVLLAWPFIDRKPRRISRRPFMLAFSFLVIGVIVGLTVLAFFHAE
jgi:quinol-cytochrome oxidoreductase complex cytochrome b subunit